MQQFLAVIMHWTGAGCGSAQGVRAWFASLADQKPPEDPDARKVWKPKYSSAHYVVNQDGAILRTVPESEVAYHVGTLDKDPVSGQVYTPWAHAKFGIYCDSPTTRSPNACCVGIELCAVKPTGEFSEETLQAAAELVADICARRGLDPSTDDVATHNMVVGWKDCPRLWVAHPNELDEFRERVQIV